MNLIAILKSQGLYLSALIFCNLLVFETYSKIPFSMKPIVKTQSGWVKGVLNESKSVVAFKGIPFAAPPVGELRWRAPQAPLPWKGVRNATKFGASAMQIKQGSRNPWTEEFMVQNDISEDCLFLNVWTPGINGPKKYAVLVYIHGGGFVEGSGGVDVYDGEELAKKGIVVVTVNYRLGVFGFLAHPELSAESSHGVSGNYGILDQLAALQWIKKNIAAFGGDPSRVTIAGQSAGASSVNALIMAPQAAGLFHGAITESGTRFSTGSQSIPSLSDAEKLGLKYAQAKGVKTIAQLRAMSPEQLMKPDSTKPQIRFGRLIDGFYQPMDMLALFARGKQQDTPFLNGYNADETMYYGNKEQDFVKIYGAYDKKLEKKAGQQQSLINANLWLEHRAKTSKSNAYTYFFTRAIPWPQHPEFGAFHTGEVPYVFHNLKMLNRPWTSLDTLVADQMSSYWVNFVKTGNPNGKGLPNWSAYSTQENQVMEIGNKTGMIPIADSQEQYDFLKRQLLNSK
jgi:para-nitrobenzyl esterase